MTVSCHSRQVYDPTAPTTMLVTVVAAAVRRRGGAMTGISDRGAKRSGRLVYPARDVIVGLGASGAIRRTLRECGNIPVAQPRHTEYTAEED
jgi:hypothetical protein